MNVLPVLPLLLLVAVERYHPMISYEVEPTQTHFLLQQEVGLKIRIVNQSDAPVKVPDPMAAANSQPVFAISGPGFQQAQQVSNWSATSGGASEPPPLVEFTLAPGETWEGELPLKALLPLREPGEFRLGSLLAWQGGRVRSADRTFRVSYPSPISAHIGVGNRPFGAAVGELAFLQREGAGAALYSARIDETDPSNSEIHLSSLVRRVNVGANATDVTSPWRNTPFYDEFLRWIVWREGRSLKCISDAEATPVSFDLPAEPSALVRPALKTKGGPVEVLALSGDHRNLQLVSIPPQLQAKPTLAWTAPLPVIPHSITTALGPETAGSPRHIAFIAPDQQGFAIFHSRYTAGGAPAAFQSVRIPSGRLHAQMPLTLLITGDNAAHVAVLARTGDKTYTLFEVQFGAAAAPPVETKIPAFEKEPAAGAIQYGDANGTIVRRDVVFLVDGAVRKLDGDGRVVPLRMPVQPFLPLVLTAGESENYILGFTAQRGFYFEPL